MPQILGHTLGTPNHDLGGAINLFAAAGLDGIEIIVLDDYRSAIPETEGVTSAPSVLKKTSEAGLFVGCLTPYITEINSTDADTRNRDVARFEAVIEIAAAVECERIRVYGGKLLGDEPPDVAVQRWGWLVDSLQHLGEVAKRAGVTLVVENHFSTMTVSAAQTARLLAEVDHPSVRALYDQANLTFTHNERPADAVALQAGLIGHVHVKDLEFIDANRPLRTGSVASIAEEDRVHRSRMIGDGILDWEEIVAAVAATGYDGTYSLEYEYRWNPQDLPAPEVGFPESSRRLRAILSRTPAASDRAMRLN